MQDNQSKQPQLLEPIRSYCESGTAVVPLVTGVHFVLLEVLEHAWSTGVHACCKDEEEEWCVQVDKRKRDSSNERHNMLAE